MWHVVRRVHHFCMHEAPAYVSYTVRTAAKQCAVYIVVLLSRMPLRYRRNREEAAPGTRTTPAPTIATADPWGCTPVAVASSQTSGIQEKSVPARVLVKARAALSHPTLYKCVHGW